jgi:hypothetical protein
MSGSARRGHRTEDIRGQECTACYKGEARIVFYQARTRFFFGCSASTKEAPCRGPKEWQSVDVPEALRKIPGAPPSPVAAKLDREKTKKRDVSDVQRADGASSGEEEIKAEAKHVKQEHI